MSFELQESIVSEYGEIRGLIHLPNRELNNKGLIVILHGYFSSDRRGPAKLYVQIARKMSDLGNVVLRFDCIGFGDSTGEFKDVTFPSAERDFRKVIEYAMKRLI